MTRSDPRPLRTPSSTHSSASSSLWKATVVEVDRPSSVTEIEPVAGTFSARSRLPQYLTSARLLGAMAEARMTWTP